MQLLATAVVLLHLAFVAFAIAGAALVLRRPRLAWLHLPAVAWAGFVELAGVTCPLTPLENALRARAGRAGYEGGFLEAWGLALLYPEGLTREIQLALGAAVLALNAAVYGWLVLRASRPASASPADSRSPVSASKR